MDCEQARELMVPHLAGSDTREERQGLQHHLQSCPACRAEADALIRTWNALAGLPDADAPAGVWERILARLPALQPASQPFPWPAIAGTAIAGLVVSIAASWLLPYERIVSLCADALRRFSGRAALPDPMVFFGVGILYGLFPLGLAALAGARWLLRAGRHPGIGAGLLFGVLVLPYVILACSALPGGFTAALMAGILAGALAGGPVGTWAGAKCLRQARAV